MADPMPEEVKAELRQVNEAKRKTLRLLKDVPPEGLQIACDYVEGELELSPAISGGRVCYLKYASEDQILALQARIPWVIKRVHLPAPAQLDGKNYAERVCFDARFLNAVLKFAVTTPHTYLSRML